MGCAEERHIAALRSVHSHATSPAPALAPSRASRDSPWLLSPWACWGTCSKDKPTTGSTTRPHRYLSTDQPETRSRPLLSRSRVNLALRVVLCSPDYHPSSALWTKAEPRRGREIITGVEGDNQGRKLPMVVRPTGNWELGFSETPLTRLTSFPGQRALLVAA